MLIIISGLLCFISGGPLSPSMSNIKKITGKADVGFVSDKQRTYPSKVKATTASIPIDTSHTMPPQSKPPKSLSM